MIDALAASIGDFYLFFIFFFLPKIHFFLNELCRERLQLHFDLIFISIEGFTGFKLSWWNFQRSHLILRTYSFVNSKKF